MIYIHYKMPRSTLGEQLKANPVVTGASPFTPGTPAHDIMCQAVPNSLDAKSFWTSLNTYIPGRAWNAGDFSYKAGWMNAAVANQLLPQLLVIGSETEAMVKTTVSITRTRTMDFALSVKDLTILLPGTQQGITWDLASGLLTNLSTPVEEDTPCIIGLRMTYGMVVVSGIRKGFTLADALQEAIIVNTRLNYYTRQQAMLYKPDWLGIGFPYGAIMLNTAYWDEEAYRFAVNLHPTPQDALVAARKLGFRTDLRFGGIMLAPERSLMESGGGGMVQLAGASRRTSKHALENRYYTPAEARELQEFLSIKNPAIISICEWLDEYRDFYKAMRKAHHDGEGGRWGYQPFAASGNKATIVAKLIEEVPIAESSA